MTLDAAALWERYKRLLCVRPEIDLWLDPSRMTFEESFLTAQADALARAFDAMEALERGAVANPDEQRRVGHYWLRAPELAPEPELAAAIRDTLARVIRFAADVRHGTVKPPGCPRFSRVLVVGIGGSALGPMLVSDALGNAGDLLVPRFLDNTDPDGIDRELGRLRGEDLLDETLVVVISKSGGTPETRNGMLETRHAFATAGVPFAPRAVAITQQGSALDRLATSEGWLARFPMWDWVGGRTSETSAVGLLPAALQGIDVEALLAGARECDRVTRDRDPRRNPAALLALCWLHATDGRGARDMVVLPYKDRLALFSRYLQQLVMESLGKERDLAGAVVHQGITVYGNKGSTDQHAYVQQLRDGVENFFATFIEVRRDREGASVEVEPGVTSGDFLDAFQHATRRALWERGRQSVTLSLSRLDARAMGVLIALFERAVGLYASLVGINAYHQPGVEAGKKAATELLALQARLLEALAAHPAAAHSAEGWSTAIGAPEAAEDCSKILEHLAANGRVRRSGGDAPWDASFTAGSAQTESDAR